MTLHPAEYESREHRALCERAIELHEADCDDGPIRRYTWVQAAEDVFGAHGIIACQAARDELVEAGICPDCRGHREPGKHDGCAP